MLRREPTRLEVKADMLEDYELYRRKREENIRQSQQEEKEQHLSTQDFLQQMKSRVQSRIGVRK